METAACKKGDTYSSANAITNSRKYIVGYIGNSNGFGNTTMEPVIWTMNSDGTYADYEKLPYPEKTSLELHHNTFCQTAFQKTAL